MRVFLLVLLGNLTMLAQTGQQATLIDVSPKQELISFALVGTDLQGTNISGKDIVAVCGAIRWGQVKDTFLHDHYFKPMTMHNGDTFQFPLSGVADYSVELRYVQFEDGSSWGQQIIGTRLAADRAKAIDFLQRAIAGYQTNGEAGFLAVVQELDESGKPILMGPYTALKGYARQATQELGSAQTLAALKIKLSAAQARLAPH
jgi:hypothetical protein